MKSATLIALALLGATPAFATDLNGPWRSKGDTITIKAARLTLPKKAGTTSLTKTGESSSQGRGIDNFAQYESPDGKVFATAYVYRATYADTALSAYATDLAVRSRFGSGVKLASQSVMPAAGQASGAIRMLYAQAVLKGDTLATAAAFVRVDDWLVKLRATGPEARAAEVTASLDALISGLSVDRKATVFAASPLTFADPCPANDMTDAKLATGKDANADLIFAGLTGGSIAFGSDKRASTTPPAFPANGATPVCVRATLVMGERRIDLLQAAGEREPATALAVFGDNASILSVERSMLGTGYTIKSYAIGEVMVRGSLDRIPSPTQLQGWLTSDNAAPLAVRSRTSFLADGKTTTTIDSAQLAE